MKSWATNLKIIIQGKELKSDITDFITELRCESSLGNVDMIAFTIMNPWTGKKNLFSDRWELLPGNEIEIWYDGKILSRGYLQRGVELFRSTEFPVLQRKAYSKEFWMTKRNFYPGGQVIRNAQWSIIADAIASDFDFETDIGTGDPIKTIHVKKDSNDFELLKTGASSIDWLFYVEAVDSPKKWKLHFHPEYPTDIAERKKFTWAHAEYSTLNWLEMDWAITDQDPEIKVLDYYEDYNQELVEKAKIEKTQSPPWIAWLAPATEIFAFRGTMINASIGNYTVNVIANKKFKNAQEAKEYVEKWFKEQERNLVVVRGEVKGDVSIKIAQHHYIEGVGELLSGQYFFHEVNHIFGDDGFKTQFKAKKMINEV